MFFEIVRFFHSILDMFVSHFLMLLMITRCKPMRYSRITTHLPLLMIGNEALLTLFVALTVFKGALPTINPKISTIKKALPALSIALMGINGTLPTINGA